MKRIIEGKRYDTETATEVATWNNGRGSSDFRALTETLYRTPKGCWFLYYDGGAMTYAAVPCGNNATSGSSGINRVSENEAKVWLESHNRIEALEQYFADQLEDA